MESERDAAIAITAGIHKKPKRDVCRGAISSRAVLDICALYRITDAHTRDSFSPLRAPLPLRVYDALHCCRADPPFLRRGRMLPETVSSPRSCMNTEDENELSVGVRYLLAFKAKAGRDGLTLQASIRRDTTHIHIWLEI